MIKRAFVLFLLCITLTGCWDSIELDRITIVTGFGIDEEDGNQINLVLQINNMSSKEGQGDPEAKSIIAESKQKDMQIALENMNLGSSRSLYFSHNQVILFGEGLAKRGISDYLDWCLRNDEIRLETYVLIARDNVKNVLKVKTKVYPNSSFTIKNLLETNISNNKHLTTNLYTLLHDYVDSNKAITIPIINVTKDSSGEEYLILTGLAVFNDDKMVGELDFVQSLGYMFVTKKLSAGTLQVQNEQDLATFDILSSKSKMDADIVDGKLKAKIDITSEFNLREIIGYEDKSINEIVDMLPSRCIDNMKMKIEDTLVTAQSLKADIFGFGAILYKKNPKLFNQYREQYPDMFAECEVELSINVEIKDIGKGANTVKREKTAHAKTS